MFVTNVTSKNNDIDVCLIDKRKYNEVKMAITLYLMVFCCSSGIKLYYQGLIIVKKSSITNGVIYE